jgi:transcriptional regulator with XRE-family HTH domain
VTAVNPPAGGELRARRKRAGWSQKQVADRLGVVQSQISYVESGERSTSEALRTAYAALFDEIEQRP